MEELKFRFWDSFNAEMVYSEGKKLSDFFLDFEKRNEAGNNCILDHFTGLKDKNCVEYYNNDIMEVNHHDSDSELEYWLIKWDEDNLMFYAHLLNSDDNYDETIADFNNLDIIKFGNIHENPELAPG